MILVRVFPGFLFGLIALHVQAAQLVAPQSVSASSYALDLMALYRESRLEDPRILAAYARARSAQEQEREALGGLLPQVSANANGNRILRKDEATREIYNS